MTEIVKEFVSKSFKKNKRIKSIIIKAQDMSISLQKLTPEDFKLLIPKMTFGIPQFFTFKHGAIKLWPLSKTPYIMEIVYE